MKRRAITVTVAERRRLVLEYAKAGLTFRAVADRVRDELGLDSYTFQQAHKDFQQALKDFRREMRLEAEEYIHLEQERLDALTEALWPKAMAGDAQAVAAVIRVMERRAKLLGLDDRIAHEPRTGGIWEFVRLVQSGADVTRPAKTIEETLGLPAPKIHIELRNGDEQDV